MQDVSNSQLDRTSPEVKPLQDLVINALQRNLLFKLAIQPKHIHSLRFSRYEPDMNYGSHTDNALMKGLGTATQNLTKATQYYS